jgi:hypothetical protein
LEPMNPAPPVTRIVSGRFSKVDPLTSENINHEGY